MKNAKWIIKNSNLALRAKDGSFITPTAAEIYAAEVLGNQEIQGYKVEKPSNSTELKFSKYPLDLEIHIITNDSTSETLKRFSCVTLAVGDKICVTILDPCSQVTDHLIHNGKWYPLVKGALEEVRRIYLDGGIESSENLNLRQYFYLIKKPSETVQIKINPVCHENVQIKPEMKRISDDEIPGFQGTLFPYQAIGYQWLRMIDKEDLGCILADEMGLGKTVQIICLIAKDVSENKKTSLVIAPATLLENWRREISKFSPHIKTKIHRGPERTGFYTNLAEFDVIITSYDTAVRDLPILSMIQWNMVVLDEAQAIKNPSALRTKSVKSIPRRLSIAVTGTPVENRLMDLWSILDFVIPSFLGSKNDFDKMYEDTESDAAALEPLVSPVILRRMVAEVAGDLPEKIEIPLPLEASPEMKEKYEEIRINLREELGKSATLVSLIKLRMFCTHQYLIQDDKENPATISPKYQRLIEILEEIFDNNEKALIFTSFSHMIDIMYLDLPRLFPGIHIDWIDGRVEINQRQGKVDEFNQTERPAILLLNPKAAGTGLNLTGANHVIHYNLEWNPAVEDQASARAYRRGQTRPVTIHRMFYLDTVEEVISERLETKRAIADEAVVGTSGEQKDYEDIMRALEITPFRNDYDEILL